MTVGAIRVFLAVFGVRVIFVMLLVGLCLAVFGIGATFFGDDIGRCRLDDGARNRNHVVGPVVAARGYVVVRRAVSMLKVYRWQVVVGWVTLSAA